MRRAIVGTAGHIDHGKTRLIEALTGIDCDRWAAEKERGITIDLGFAHLDAPDNGELRIGFIDVPGHERFLHNALAGLGGIRVMLLAVAADEGVKPQTREHLAICSLLGIPAGVVALTKTDLVDKDLVEVASQEVEELLAGTPFGGSPVLPVSSVTGAGIAELKARIETLARHHAVEPSPDQPARLPVDRAFLLQGLGLVVTGTLVAGEIRTGEVLECDPGGETARVRAIQVHGQPTEIAHAGERTALQLTGIDHALLERGVQLVAPGGYTKTRRLLVSYRHLASAPKPLDGSLRVRAHLLAGEYGARLRPVEPVRLEPGEEGIAEIRLAAPAAAAVGDRLIVRRPSPPLTLGGGAVLDPAWRPKTGIPPRSAVADREQLLLSWVERAGEAGIETTPMAQRLGFAEAALEPELRELQQSQRLLLAPAGSGHGPRWLTPGTYRRVSDRARQVLDAYFKRNRLAQSISKAEAVERMFPGRGAELADVYVDWLARQNVLHLESGQVRQPGRDAVLSTEESKLSRRLTELFDEAGLQPPSPAELRDRLRAQPQILEGIIGYLIESGRLMRLPGGLVIAASALDDLTDRLRRTGWTEFAVADFKREFDLTRKWAIPLLEQLDSVGVTRRVGDRRQIVER